MNASHGAPTVKPHDPTDTSPAVSLHSDGRFELRGLTVRGLIFMANPSKSIVTPGQVVDGPTWLDTDTFDVTVQGEGELVGPQGYTPRLLSLLQSVLKEQFKVSVKPGTREMPGHELVVTESPARLGANIKPSGAGAAAAGGRMMMESGELVQSSNPDPTRGLGWQRTVTVLDGRSVVDVHAKGVTMYEAALHFALSPINGPVFDRTGLQGKFDITGLRYVQADTRTVPSDRHAFTDSKARPTTATGREATRSELSKALSEQLGLALRPTTGSVDVLVVEAASRPN